MYYLHIASRKICPLVEYNVICSIIFFKALTLKFSILNSKQNSYFSLKKGDWLVELQMSDINRLLKE